MPFQKIPTRTAKIIGLGTFLAVGCQLDPTIDEFNGLPIADAKVLINGVAMDQKPDGSIAELNVPFDGTPVAVTLDGTASQDPDGQITGYRWLSGTRIPDAGAPRPWLPDAGTPVPFWRSVPAGEASSWPSDEAMPTVVLGEGTFSFSLWVLDDRGGWSSPDTIRFSVGRGRPADDAGTAMPVRIGMDAGLPAP